MPQLKGSPPFSERVPFIEGSGDVSNQSLARADVTNVMINLKQILLITVLYIGIK